MTAANGYLPLSELAPITGGVVGDDPAEGHLVIEAAAAWNAMAVHIHDETGVWIGVTGPVSSYRPYAVQEYFWNLYQSGQGNLAAVPGTSNHGWGLACDVPQAVRTLIDQYGAPFGWAKIWSDAPTEWWHLRYAPGHWSGPDPGPYGNGSGHKPVNRYPTLKVGDHGGAVRRAQRHLHRWLPGVEQGNFDIDADFGKDTVKAVVAFQIIHGLKPDGQIGPSTWAALRAQDPFLHDERAHFNDLRLLRHRKGKLTAAQRKRVRGDCAWMARRARAIAKTAKEDGWSDQHRRHRFHVLTTTARTKPQTRGHQ